MAAGAGPVQQHDGESALAAGSRWHFQEVSANNAPHYDARHLARIQRRIVHLRSVHRPGFGRFDAPFAEGELVAALASADGDTAAGPDGVPYAALKSDHTWWRSAVLAFLQLAHRSGLVPSSWKLGIVVPLFKAGSRDEHGNYRPITLVSCFLTVYERLLLARLVPVVDPQLDPSQAGFCWGADEQGHTLTETLRLRGNTRTWCACGHQKGIRHSLVRCSAVSHSPCWGGWFSTVHLG